MLSSARYRVAGIVLMAGVLTAAGACAAQEPEAPPSPKAGSTFAPEPSATTPSPTATTASPEPSETETEAPEPIPHAGEEVRVGPQDTVPYYDLDQSFDHPPHVADMQVTDIEWDWTPEEGASGMCEYDPADGRYLAVYLEIESNERARSYGTPFSGEDFIITDDAGEEVAEYRDWDSLACMNPGEEITVSLHRNESYTGALVFAIQGEATQLRVDFYFDDDGVTPLFIWDLTDF